VRTGGLQEPSRSEEHTVSQSSKTEAERRRGAIYETADGRLRGSILLPLPDGTSKRVYLSGRTRAEITRKLDAKRKESDTGAVTGEDLGAARSILRREIKEEAKLLSEVRVEAPAANRPEEAPARPTRRRPAANQLTYFVSLTR